MTTPSRKHTRPKKPERTPEATELRSRAEKRLREQRPETSATLSEADAQRLVHELQVHQVELEMQNEHLREARDATEALLEKYTDLYDFAPVGYVTLDREGTILAANLYAATLFGTDRSRLLQQRFRLRVPMANRPAFASFLQKVSASKARESCEMTLLKEGDLPFDARIEASLAASGEEYRAVVTDITASKRAQMDRLVLSKLESAGVLAGGIAHDFNNLLTVILLDLELARTLPIPSGDELMHRLEDAEKAAWAARNLTLQLLTFSRGGTPVRKPTQLSGVIREAVGPALSGSLVRCEFSLPEDLWLVDVDAGQFGQVIRNLATNAREASSDGGAISVRAENVVLIAGENPALPPGEYLCISIADRGGGIAHDVLPRIFDPYFSTKHPGKGKGMGLGLTICHAIVRKHSGAMVVQSEVGVGTTVHTYLPASRMRHSEAKAPAPTAAVRRHARILVMDDEKSLRNAVGGILRQMDHDVELVKDGRSAIDAYTRAHREQRPFDLVLLDLTIREGPGGKDVLQALLKIDPNVKALVMTGYSEDPAAVEPERHGFAGSLLKPFGGGKLRDTISRFLPR